MMQFRVWLGLAAAMALMGISGCAGGASSAVDDVESVSIDEDLSDYTLGSSDRIRLIVYGEPELSGEFSVNASGHLSLPLIGDVLVEGLTIEQVRSRIATELSQGYVLDARVAAEIIQYRPYYILGEVGNPGQYPYSDGMSVIKAVAAAGGFTYRANKSVVFIKRADAAEEIKVKMTSQLSVLPGDVVRVGERFF